MSLAYCWKPAPNFSESRNILVVNNSCGRNVYVAAAKNKQKRLVELVIFKRILFTLEPQVSNGTFQKLHLGCVMLPVFILTLGIGVIMCKGIHLLSRHLVTPFLLKQGCNLSAPHYSLCGCATVLNYFQNLMSLISALVSANLKFSNFM